jgi:hypothetical protein
MLETVLPGGADGQVATGAEPLQTFPALNQSGVASWLVNAPSGEPAFTCISMEQADD